MSIIRPLSIGSVEIPNNLILGPMAGVTDLPFRRICHEHGAGLVCMEMVSAKAVYYGNKNTEELLMTEPEERPVSMQLFGSDPDIMSAMAKKLSDRGVYDIVDINMGCPVPKIVGNNEGSALMKSPKLVGEIVKKVSEAIDVPLTVKIRSGFDAKHINAVEIAVIAEENGASAISVHARTREQMYSGEADYSVIRKVKESVGIPVIGSGDIRSASDVTRMYEEAGCDGFMIARAAEGDPWIFERILGFFETGCETARPDIGEVIDMIISHAEAECELKGEYIAVRQMRRHAAYYTAGYPDSAGLRRNINAAESMDELKEMLRAYEESCNRR